MPRTITRRLNANPEATAAAAAAAAKAAALLRLRSRKGSYNLAPVRSVPSESSNLNSSIGSNIPTNNSAYHMRFKNITRSAGKKRGKQSKQSKKGKQRKKGNRKKSQKTK